jgi:hypothetical protein
MTFLKTVTSSHSFVSRTALRRSAGLLALLTFGWSAAADAYPLRFPARGDSLPSGVHFESDGHTGEDYGNNTWAIDISALEFRDSQWRSYKASAIPGSETNSDHVAFGAALYAPEDGEIVACWRTAPEKPGPNTDYDIDGDGVFGEEGDDASPLGGGNHLQIRNAAGDYIVLFAHMQSGSIPPELCPLPASRDPNGDGWPDSTATTCSLGGDWDGWRTATVLPTPVPVEAGQFIGRLGHSGRSSGPHLHMHVKPFTTDPQGTPCEGPSEEIEFVETWAQTCEPGQDVTTFAWDPLQLENPLEAWTLAPSEDPGGTIGTGPEWIETPRWCFLPDAIGAQQDHHDLGVAATNLHFTTHSSGDTLVYQSGGALRLRSYKLLADGSLSDQSTLNEGSVLDVAAVRPRSSRNVVVSIRGTNGDLKHIPYTVSSTTGAIVRQVGKELSEGAVYQVETTPSPAHDGFVAAIEDGAGNLKVIDYHVDSALNIARDFSGSGTGGAIDELAITTTRHVFEGVVTAELTTSGWLVVRSFEVPAAGGVTNADVATTFVQGESVTIDAVPVMYGLGEYVVTGVRQTGSDVLRLDTWFIDPAGEIEWVDTISAGSIVSHDATSTVSGGDLVSVVRDDQDNFRMIGWRIDGDGGIARNATRALSAVTQTAVVAPLGSGLDHLVAARTDAQGELHLFSYGSAFSPSW